MGYEAPPIPSLAHHAGRLEVVSKRVANIGCSLLIERAVTVGYGDGLFHPIRETLECNCTSHILTRWFEDADWEGGWSRYDVYIIHDDCPPQIEHDCTLLEQ